MKLPSTQAYKDVHSGMKSEIPQVTIGRVQEYFGLYDKQLEEKSIAMYKER